MVFSVSHTALAMKRQLIIAASRPEPPVRCRYDRVRAARPRFHCLNSRSLAQHCFENRPADHEDCAIQNSYVEALRTHRCSTACLDDGFSSNRRSGIGTEENHCKKQWSNDARYQTAIDGVPGPFPADGRQILVSSATLIGNGSSPGLVGKLSACCEKP